jgi:hypothetical protein
LFVFWYLKRRLLIAAQRCLNSIAIAEMAWRAYRRIAYAAAIDVEKALLESDDVRAREIVSGGRAKVIGNPIDAARACGDAMQQTLCGACASLLFCYAFFLIL